MLQIRKTAGYLNVIKQYFNNVKVFTKWYRSEREKLLSLAY